MRPFPGSTLGLFLFLLFPALAGASEGGKSLVTPLVPQIVWAVVTLGVVFLILAKGAWPVILEALDERARRIEENLKAAERARQEAELDKEKLRREMERERLRLREAVAKMEEDIAKRLSLIHI